MKRRDFLKSSAGVLAVGASGCLNPEDEQHGNANSKEDISLEKESFERYLSYSFEKLRNNQVSGGPGKDGIPSIDDPVYKPSDEYDQSNYNDNIVFGIELNDDAKAFPRTIIANHEIVNTVVGGKNISVTYCPLTGTCLAFGRGETELGVSGDLINNNLVMYDRENDFRWPQMLGVSISEEEEGFSLKEYDIAWTTWEKWKGKYPSTQFLSRETGFLRDYSSGPYGEYQERKGYYVKNSSPLFNTIEEYSDSLRTKEVVFGCRTDKKAYAIRKERLKENKLEEFSNVVAVYEDKLDTSHFYKKNNSNIKVNKSNNKFVIDNEKYNPEELPLNKVNSYESMWFAWDSYYPNSETKL